MPGITTEEVKVKDNLRFAIYGTVNGSAEISGIVIAKLSALAVPNTSSAPTDHVNIYRDIPEWVKDTIENDWQSYNYIALKTVDSIVYIGEPWIISGTLYRDDIVTANVVIDSFRDSDSSALRFLLESNGYSVKKITVV